MSAVEFRAWPKIHRWTKDWVITEKIDGTNACVIVPENESEPLVAQSRQRLLTVEADNFGFAKWVQDNSIALRKLGLGYHYGEWWGQGIQRGYGQMSRHFSLFNPFHKNLALVPCVSVVPVLAKFNAQHYYVDQQVESALFNLQKNGSAASAGFMHPEGVVIYHGPSGALFKKTYDNDEGKERSWLSQDSQS